MASNLDEEREREATSLLGRVARKEARKIKGRRERERGPLFYAGMFGLVGWAVALPTVLGLWLGTWADATWPGQPSWTLVGIVLGVAAGCLNAWYWVRRESGRED